MKNKIIVKLKNQNSVYIYYYYYFFQREGGIKKIKEPKQFFLLKKTYFRCRDLNPGLSGESRVS